MNTIYYSAPPKYVSSFTFIKECREYAYSVGYFNANCDVKENIAYYYVYEYLYGYEALYDKFIAALSPSPGLLLDAAMEFHAFKQLKESLSMQSFPQQIICELSQFCSFHPMLIKHFFPHFSCTKHDIFRDYINFIGKTKRNCFHLSTNIGKAIWDCCNTSYFIENCTKNVLQIFTKNNIYIKSCKHIMKQLSDVSNDENGAIAKQLCDESILYHSKIYHIAKTYKYPKIIDIIFQFNFGSFWKYYFFNILPKSSDNKWSNKRTKSQRKKSKKYNINRNLKRQNEKQMVYNDYNKKNTQKQFLKQYHEKHSYDDHWYLLVLNNWRRNKLKWCNYNTYSNNNVNYYNNNFHKHNECFLLSNKFGIELWNECKMYDFIKQYPQQTLDIARPYSAKLAIFFNYNEYEYLYGFGSFYEEIYQYLAYSDPNLVDELTTVAAAVFNNHDMSKTLRKLKFRRTFRLGHHQPRINRELWNKQYIQQNITQNEKWLLSGTDGSALWNCCNVYQFVKNNPQKVFEIGKKYSFRLNNYPDYECYEFVYGIGELFEHLCSLAYSDSNLVLELCECNASFLVFGFVRLSHKSNILIPDDVTDMILNWVRPRITSYDCSTTNIFSL